MKLTAEERERYQQIGIRAEIARLQGLLNGHANEVPVNGHAAQRGIPSADWTPTRRAKHSTLLRKLWDKRKGTGKRRGPNRRRQAATTPAAATSSTTPPAGKDVKVIPLPNIPADIKIKEAILFTLLQGPLSPTNIADSLLASPWTGTRSPRTSKHFRQLVSASMGDLGAQKQIVRTANKIGAPWKILPAGVERVKAQSQQ